MTRHRGNRGGGTPLLFPQTTPSITPPNGQWLSGVGGMGYGLSGTPGFLGPQFLAKFGGWRGRQVDIIRDWNDVNEGVAAFESNLATGGKYSQTAWPYHANICFGGLYADSQGESWATAATGAMDTKWTTEITNMKTQWGARPGTCFLTPFHELNGGWYEWRVASGQETNFKTAWARLRTIQQSVWPASKLGVCFNATNNNAINYNTMLDATKMDFLSVDFYNQYPDINDATAYASNRLSTDSGMPRGFGAWINYAGTLGLPLIVGEWSNPSDHGDHSGWIPPFYADIVANSGSGAGKVLAEILFNDPGFNSALGNGKSPSTFELWPQSAQPLTTVAYKKAW